ncbi:hypothetical protein [Candidatus Oscillochloris fontis]|uniref:hypothetical protein n=1 Tax=Candidatus Oscillochloris fontis TaxID=2496868 RepID=UPI00101B980F|nr:hypothetical protein [Candidatus Oscillochloris fontis]
MLKRIIIPLIVFTLLLGTLALRPNAVLAQRDTTAIPGVWTNAVLIRNTSETAAAGVRIDFYQGSSLVLSYPAPSAPALNIDANGLLNVFIPDLSQLGRGQYSAVVSSNQKVAVSVQISSVDQITAPWTAFAYEGVDAANTAQKLFFPAAMKSFYGFFSEVVIQNTSATTATTLTADFYSATGTKLNLIPIQLGTLAANGTKTYATSDALFTSLPSGPTGSFGMVVNSSATNIAGIANVWRTTPTNMSASYNAFISGSRTAYAPNLMNRFYGFGSALSIQNVDQTDTAVGTVTYSGGGIERFSLAPNASIMFLQFNRNTTEGQTIPSGNVNGTFSAKIEVTSTGGSIVAVVGYSRSPELNGGAILGDYAYYNCPSQPTPKVIVPSVMSNFYGFFTNISVQNTGDPTYIQLTYQDGKTWRTPAPIPTNGIANFNHLAKNPNNPFGSVRTSTAAIASAVDVNGNPTTSPLVVLVQHNTDPSVLGYKGRIPGDYLHVFSGTPMQ